MESEHAMDGNEKERLSALLDGELDGEELDRLLASVGDEAMAAWGRYHLARAALRGEGGAVAPELAAGVRRALEREPPFAPRRPARSAGIVRGLARIAIAASVAAAATVALQSSLDRGGAPAVAERDAPPRAAPAAVAAAAPAEFEVDPVARERLRRYIESMRVDEELPMRVEHIQDSPLYRLVNELSPPVPRREP